MASSPQPHKTRIRSTTREFQFYVSKASEINRKFAGKHVAIIGDRVVASGSSPLDVWEKAKRLHPQGRPLLAYVPKRDTLVFPYPRLHGSLRNFPR